MNDEERERYRSGADLIKMNKGNSTQPPKMPRRMSTEEAHQAASNLDYDDSKRFLKGLGWGLLLAGIFWGSVFTIIWWLA